MCISVFLCKRAEEKLATHAQTPLEAPRTGVQTFTESIRIARRSVNMDTTVRPRQPGHDVKYDMLFLA